MHDHDDQNQDTHDNPVVDEHAHRNLGGAEEPLDAANESLSDALISSFRILKGIMLVLMFLFIFSNVRGVDTSEQALQLRLGSLYDVHDPGLVWAMPYPIDEIVPMPTKKSNELLITSHSFRRHSSEIGIPLAVIARDVTEGLDPVHDGALLTADSGLVHTQWKITYKIDDLRSFVSMVKGDNVETAESLIRSYIETVGVHVASELTAEEIIRTRLEYVRSEMKKRVNDRLRAINSGIDVTQVEMYEPTPPLQVRSSFDNAQKAENRQRAVIAQAEQARVKILNESAGAAYTELVEALDRRENAKTEGRSLEDSQRDIDRILNTLVEGIAGILLKEAGAQLSVLVGQIQSDVELYRTLLPEYESNPDLLIARLWEQTRESIFMNPGVTKIYRPLGCQFRLTIPLDPKETQLAEERRLAVEKYDITKLKGRRKSVLIN
ncbi:hypothetical protein JYU10_00130 [bacterium AH-315-J04]|nr:hypothetical protein [bacterium AH-315-J04]